RVLCRRTSSGKVSNFAVDGALRLAFTRSWQPIQPSIHQSDDAEGRCLEMPIAARIAASAKNDTIGMVHGDDLVSLFEGERCWVTGTSSCGNDSGSRRGAGGREKKSPINPYQSTFTPDGIIEVSLLKSPQRDARTIRTAGSRHIAFHGHRGVNCPSPV